MSETPRTTAFKEAHKYKSPSKKEWQAHSEQLERELAAANAWRNEAEGELVNCGKRIGALVDKLAAANERAARLEGDAKRYAFLKQETYEHKNCDAIEPVYMSINKSVPTSMIDAVVDDMMAALLPDSEQKENKS